MFLFNFQLFWGEHGLSIATDDPNIYYSYDIASWFTYEHDKLGRLTKIKNSDGNCTVHYRYKRTAICIIVSFSLTPTPSRTMANR